MTTTTTTVVRDANGAALSTTEAVRDANGYPVSYGPGYPVPTYRRYQAGDAKLQSEDKADRRECRNSGRRRRFGGFRLSEFIH